MADSTKPDMQRTRQIDNEIEMARPFRADAIPGLEVMHRLGSGASSTVYLGR
ncbi:hypothetical protein HZA57_00690, partial [Candidatus Poribacteria bacterium]|nr:hypothetical protein [Candidatus Poribacteria bacterium]